MELLRDIRIDNMDDKKQDVNKLSNANFVIAFSERPETCFVVLFVSG